MNPSDVQSVLQWWLTILLLGTGFLPLTILLFGNFFDKGYIFAKVFGLAIVSYAVFILGVLHLLPFRESFSFLILFTLTGAIYAILLKKTQLFQVLKQKLPIFIFEELLFLGALFFWAYIHSFNPEIRGLEKYMDYGFLNSILRSEYFPPRDMWFTPLSINYYYFGHLTTAVLTKLSGLSSSITFNLMLSTIFALCFAETFSLGANLYTFIIKSEQASTIRRFVSGLLTALLVTLSGNLHILYAFFKPYENELPVPLWKLLFTPSTFPNSYWYPNATRFIYNTIHEFPIYSWVVADLHGHVLDIPFVLLTIAVLLSFFFSENGKWKMENGKLLLIGFLLAVMYMTNAWDGGIYLLLALLVLLSTQYKNLKNFFLSSFIVGISLAIFSLPYNYFFKPFASGIGILCSPEFLTKIGKLGPFLFEKNYCQHSPWWQLLILYGFFYFFVISFLVFMRHLKKLTQSDIFVFLLIILSTFLIVLPEFIYLKDIYPAHYRANTMFKLVFQAFIMLSVSSGYIFVRLISNIKYQKSKIFNFYFVFFIFAFSLFTLVLTYPILSVNSYYGLDQKDKKPVGLNGTAYLQNIYPEDFKAIGWINRNIKGQPVILEAQGDSYTDYARVSANTGLPTVLGWTVHEWLWRGTYDIPAPRINEVKTIYETQDVNTARRLIEKYKVEYVFVGTLEQQKYLNLSEAKFQSLGKIVFQNNNTKIYKVD